MYHSPDMLKVHARCWYMSISMPPHGSLPHNLWGEKPALSWLFISPHSLSLKIVQLGTKIVAQLGSLGKSSTKFLRLKIQKFICISTFTSRGSHIAIKLTIDFAQVCHTRCTVPLSPRPRVGAKRANLLLCNIEPSTKNHIKTIFFHDNVIQHD